jgi:hypothetical protein
MEFWPGRCFFCPRFISCLWLANSHDMIYLISRDYIPFFNSDDIGSMIRCDVGNTFKFYTVSALKIRSNVSNKSPWKLKINYWIMILQSPKYYISVILQWVKA